MRLLKFLTVLSIVTMAALIYVHGQVELVKLSYAIEIKEKKFKDMLDRKERLGYNIDSLENPSRLESFLLAHKIDIVFPGRRQVVRVAKSTAHREDHLKKALFEKKAGIFSIFEFLSPRAEAEGFKEK